MTIYGEEVEIDPKGRFGYRFTLSESYEEKGIHLSLQMGCHIMAAQHQSHIPVSG